MNLKSLSALGAGLLLAACSQAPRTDSLTQYVDMRIGTGGHGHVFMGANVPFGAVQLGPTSIPQSWDWTSGYHISDTTVIGFSHTHLNGTGIGDLFDVTVMPVVGQVTYARGTEDDPQSGMWSYFSHANEKARPGYYATRLDRYGIDVELTATKRVGLHKYPFPASADAAVVFDLENGGCWDAPTETFIERADDHTISGYRYSTGWAKDQRVYFTAEFSKPFKSLAIYEGGEGKLTKQHAWMHVLYANELASAGKAAEAYQVYMNGVNMPKSYGEAKTWFNQEAHIFYYLGTLLESLGKTKEAANAFEEASVYKAAVSELSMFRALALRKLMRFSQAQQVLTEMLESGDNLLKNKDMRSYYGVGSPTPMPFEYDIVKINSVNGHILRGYALLGLGRRDEAEAEIAQAAAYSPNDFRIYAFHQVKDTF